MVTTKKKTSEILPETESVTPTPTYQDVYATGTTGASSPTRVGNKMYSNSGGGEVVSGEGGAPTPMTYEQWYTAQQNKINQDTQAAKDLANINYQKSKSEYGSKAAALESMGLTGSGYSDYLNSQAYAQMQSAYANADAQRAQSMLDLDTKYMDILDQQKREEKQRQDTINSNFVTAMGSITADTTDTEIEQMAALGFSPEQIESLKTQRNDLATKRTKDEDKAATEKQKTAYQTILGMINHETSDDMIDALAAAYGLTDADMIANAKTYQNTYLTDYLKSLDPTELTVDDLNRYYPDKTDENYTTFLNKIITSAKDLVYDGMFDGTDKTTDTSTYNNIKGTIKAAIEKTDDKTIKDGLEDTLKTLDSEYNSQYNPGETLFYYDKKAAVTKGMDNDAYKNIVVTRDGTKYKIQYADGWNKAATDAAKEAKVAKGEVFVYDNELFVMKSDGYAYRLQGRDRNTDYQTLKAAITGET